MSTFLQTKQKENSRITTKKIKKHILKATHDSIQRGKVITTKVRKTRNNGKHSNGASQSMRYMHFWR